MYITKPQADSVEKRILDTSLWQQKQLIPIRDSELKKTLMKHGT
jgi:hypothetical protein